MNLLKKDSDCRKIKKISYEDEIFEQNRKTMTKYTKNPQVSERPW